jgi:hypothetical protein
LQHRDTAFPPYCEYLHPFLPPPAASLQQALKNAMGSIARVPFLELQQYNHIALPRNVPGREDSNLQRVEGALLQRMLDAVARLTPHIAEDIAPHVQGLRGTLLACQVLNVDGTIGKAALIKELRDLDHGKMLVLHIAPQNCALLVYPRTTSEERTVIFEAFETSATADKVLAAKGALQWDCKWLL